MSLGAYLSQGMLVNGALRAELENFAIDTGRAWLDAAVDVAVVELASELVVRWAEHLPEDARVDLLTFRAELAVLDLPDLVHQTLGHAFVRPLERLELAALAIHLLEIAEKMAFALFGPELPGLHAKSDRTGGAARSAGVARRLKG